MNEVQNRIDLLNSVDVKRALIRLGLPSMTGMLVSACYNIADAFFVGRLGTSQTAAVSVIYPLTMIGTGIGLLFGNGAGSGISRLLGKNDYKNTKVLSSTAIISGMITIILCAAALLLFLNPVIHVLGAFGDSFSYAMEYGSLYILGLIFNVFNMMMNNLTAAEGASAFGMTAMLAGGFANLILDPILIFSCGMGVGGAAAATLVSRLISMSFYIYYLHRGQSFLADSLRYFKPGRAVYKEIFKIGLPVCFFQFLTGAAVSLTNIAARPFGEAAIAAMGIVNRIMSLETSALYGFLKGYSPLVGYSWGAGNMTRVKAATKTAITWSTSANIIFGMICFVFARQLIVLFNQESSAVLEIGSAALRADALSFMTLGIQIVIGNYFLAVGKARQGGMLSVFRQGMFFIPFLLIFSRIWGIAGMIISQPAADLCAAAVTLAIWKREPPLQAAQKNEVAERNLMR